MAIWTVQDRRVDRSLGDFQAPLSDVLGAAFDEGIAGNPTALLSQEIDKRSDSPTLSKSDALAQAKNAGVNVDVPDDGISQGALQVLIDRRLDENRRAEVLSRAAPGFGTGALRLGAGLVASLFDPINVASAFIPIVGEARYARMLGQAAGGLGRAGVRAGVGAVEGAAGAALVEPLVYGLRRDLQDDYSMADSLANIAFGAVGGGILHAGGGAARDVLQGADRFEAYRGLTTKEVQQVMDFRRNPGEIPEDWSDAMRRAAGVDLRDSPEAAHVTAVNDLNERIRTGQVTPEDLQASLKSSPEVTRDAVFGRISDQETPFDRAAGIDEARSVELAEREVFSDVQANPQRYTDQDRAAVEAGNIPESLSQRVQDRAAQIYAAAQMRTQIEGTANRASTLVDRADPQTRTAAAQTSIAQTVEGRHVDVQTVFDADPRVGKAASQAEILAAARRNNSPESIAVADFEYARLADERIRQAPKGEAVEQAQAELDAELERLADAAKASGQELDSNLLKEADDLIKRSEQYALAAKAAATCQLGG